MIDYEVTIGIPVYNVEKYIRQTMDAALAQTFQSIEFLICDDCGVDGSIGIVREIQQTHPRGKDIRIVSQPYNMGTGAARNRLIDEAKGRYLYFLDADDIIIPHAIQLLYECAQKYQAEMVYGSYERIIRHDGKEVERIASTYPFRVFSEPDAFAQYAFHTGVQVMHWNRLTDIEVYRRNHLRVAEVGAGYGEDFSFTVDLPTYVTRVVLLPDVLYHFIFEDVETRIRQKRRTKRMRRDYMDLAIAAIDQKKRRIELKGRPYYAKRCAVLMMYDYSFVCQILSRRDEPQPRYTNREIRDVMWHPMSLADILRAPEERSKNLMAWLFGALPPRLSVPLMWLVAKLTHRLSHFEIAEK